MGERTTFFNLDRSIFGHWVWKNPETARAWVELIGFAAVSDHIFIDDRNTSVLIRRGQLPTSDDQLAARWKWSRGKVRRFLARLERDEMIKVYRTKRGTIITVTNYSKFQDKKTKKRTSNRTTNDTGEAVEMQGVEPNGGTTDDTTDGTRGDTRGGTSGGTHQRMDKERIKNGERGKPAPAVPLRGIMNNVEMTDEEYEKLCQSYERPKALIDKISTIIANSGKKYRSHYALAVKIAEEDGFTRRPVIHRAEPEPEKQEGYIPMPDDTRAIFDKWKEGTKVK